MVSQSPAQTTAERLNAKPVLTVLGMMSGTSMDGIDVALMRTDGQNRIETMFRAEYAYDAAFKQQIAAAVRAFQNLKRPGDRPDGIGSVEGEITRRHAEAVRQVLRTVNLEPERVDLIGFHGQTVLHRPDLGFTVQLGDGQALADQTAIPVVHDLRSNDMAHGGQGAPLVPIYHKALAGRLDETLPVNLRGLMPVAFVNIGGISNLTYVDGDSPLIAFDTGPGNALIDQWVEAEAGIPFDQDGAIASEGGVIKPLAKHYLAESFFEQPVPKSLDRNDFLPPASRMAGLEDGARTLAYVSAAAIMKAVDHLPKAPQLWIISGGGRKNPAIMSDLAKLAEERFGARVIACEEAGFDGDSMEAEAWAYLAVRSVKGLPITFQHTTGCTEAVTGGKLTFPNL